MTRTVGYSVGIVVGERIITVNGRPVPRECAEYACTTMISEAAAAGEVQLQLTTWVPTVTGPAQGRVSA